MTQPEFELQFNVSGSVGFQMMQLGEEGRKSITDLGTSWTYFDIPQNCVQN